MRTSLNQRAWQLCDELVARAEELRIQSHTVEGGTRIIDCGCRVTGSLEAGQRLAEICLSNLGRVSLVNGSSELWPGPAVQIITDAPIAACLASQYAGWQVKGDKFFAMGSGPMRAAAANEDLFATIGHTECPSQAVGVLESRQLPSPAICADLAAKCHVSTDQLTLVVAPTSSLAGTIQIVARSVETALHKLHELKFDLKNIDSGYGTAPLPPVAKDDLAGIGRTNDAILYGGEVTLWVHGDDESIQSLGPKIPSCASRDHGRPFADLFAHYGHDFYKIDPHLFSPAVITLMNLSTGRTHRFGHTLPRVIHESFGK